MPFSINIYHVVIFVLCVLALVLAYFLIKLKLTAGHDAEEMFSQWKEHSMVAELERERKLIELEASNMIERWQLETEAEIRKDAVARSQASTIGKVTEHLIPYMPVFPYNPKDARFIGSPIDFVVFDGANDGEVREVVFIEIKTRTSQLSSRQRQIRNAVTSGRVAWREMRVDE